MCMYWCMYVCMYVCMYGWMDCQLTVKMQMRNTNTQQFKNIDWTHTEQLSFFWNCTIACKRNFGCNKGDFEVSGNFIFAGVTCTRELGYTWLWSCRIGKANDVCGQLKAKRSCPRESRHISSCLRSQRSAISSMNFFAFICKSANNSPALCFQICSH